MQSILHPTAFIYSHKSDLNIREWNLFVKPQPTTELKMK